jgi:hypothetical protein
MRQITIYQETISNQDDSSVNEEHEILYYSDEDSQEPDFLDTVVRKITGITGSVEASSSEYHKGVWYTSIDFNQDMHSGDYIGYTAHLSGFSEAEERQIYNKLKGKK